MPHTTVLWPRDLRAHAIRPYKRVSGQSVGSLSVALAISAAVALGDLADECGRQLAIFGLILLTKR